MSVPAPAARAPWRPAPRPRAVVAIAVALLAALLLGGLLAGAARAAPGGSVSGTVVDDGGEPLSGATITVGRLVDEWQVTDERHATSDALGRYRFDGLPAGRYRLLAALAGHQHVAANWYGPQGDVADGRTTTLDAVLVGRSATIRGRVVATDGTPIAGAEVRHEWDGTTVTTDAAGRYELHVVPVDAFLQISAVGYRPRYPGRDPRSAELLAYADRGQVTDHPDVVLRRAATAACWDERGSWLQQDAAGRALPGADAPVWPRAQRLCPDVEASELPPDGGDAPAGRPGIPKPPLPRLVPTPVATPAPRPVAAPARAAPPRVSAPVLERGRRLVLTTRCPSRCRGRIEVTTTVATRAGRRTVTLARIDVPAGTGRRRHVASLSARARRLAAPGPRRAVTIRWRGTGGTKATRTRLRSSR